MVGTSKIGRYDGGALRTTIVSVNHGDGEELSTE